MTDMELAIRRIVYGNLIQKHGQKITPCLGIELSDEICESLFDLIKQQVKIDECS